MSADASLSHDESNRSATRDALHGNLVRALERMRTIDHRPSYDALRLLVDALVSDGFTPEATVIAVKSAIEQSGCLLRLDRPLRERVRVALVAYCIDRYFETRELISGLPPASEPIALPRSSAQDAEPSAPSA
ncbi:MAG TPA: hypothetical protein VGP25_20010 [Gemmatimonadaceae bacterium]|nr:hypothetical protein [Gemmatimonadaceae bacterium]